VRFIVLVETKGQRLSKLIGVPGADIKLEPDKAVTKVQDKFMLHLGEEEALKNFESLLNEISSWAAVLDRLHAAAQYFRT
jgi:phosphatidylinositol 3-kinase